MTRLRGAVIAAAALAGAAPAAADPPLRLRADALATTSAPAGLLVLAADAAPRDGVTAEAVVWMAGATALDDGAAGDVLVIAVAARSRSGDLGGRVGRFVSALGALRPVHVDGGGLRVRLPHRFELEAAGGVPVQTGLVAARSWDWVIGARASRRLGDGGSLGLAYGHRRDAGQLAGEELAADAGLALGRRSDLGARIAYDLASPGVAEAALTASHRGRRVRGDVYAGHRAVSHLVPASSLFSVLGDVPSQRAGVLVTWRAAPRLDLAADAGVRYADELGGELVARARLRLDDRGAGALTGELRRSGVGDAAWTGLRGAARVPLPRALALTGELELVIADVDRGRGAVWPWGVIALAWDRGDWRAAVAVEGRASPDYRWRVDALAQLGRSWGR